MPNHKNITLEVATTSQLTKELSKNKNYVTDPRRVFNIYSATAPTPTQAQKEQFGKKAEVLQEVLKHAKGHVYIIILHHVIVYKVLAFDSNKYVVRLQELDEHAKLHKRKPEHFVSDFPTLWSESVNKASGLAGFHIAVKENNQLTIIDMDSVIIHKESVKEVVVTKNSVQTANTKDTVKKKKIEKAWNDVEHSLRKQNVFGWEAMYTSIKSIFDKSLES